jgi:hypothetical protein
MQKLLCYIASLVCLSLTVPAPASAEKPDKGVGGIYKQQMEQDKEFRQKALESGREERKRFQEQSREERKQWMEQESEERKKWQEMDRDQRKHWQEQYQEDMKKDRFNKERDDD